MKIFNTLTGKKEKFEPVDALTVRMYVCGVTPYDAAHIGHGLSYTIFDVVRRYLEFQGYKVRHVQNFTDIDDKIIERSGRLGILPQELAEKHIQSFLQEMDELNILRADVYPRATDELPKMIEMIEGLIGQGYAYPSEGDVYFRVRKVEGYGKLSGRELEGMLAGARIDPGERKEYPMDFALWKGSKAGEPEWPSPWGPGRPGWHIECSAMSLRHLGDVIDLHGGGQDLVFPHHENEIAQSESFTGQQPFARVWMHNGHLQLGEEKMSKSLGNLVTARDALDQYGSDSLRLFFLSSHYRSPLTFADQPLESSVRAIGRLRTALTAISQVGISTVESEPYRERFIAAMDDDFNTPQALAALFDLAREINRGVSEGADCSGAQRTLRELAGVLGLTLEATVVVKQEGVSAYVELLIEIRTGLRDAKLFSLADRVRDRLADLGVTIEDGPEGTRWRFS